MSHNHFQNHDQNLWEVWGFLFLLGQELESSDGQHSFIHFTQNKHLQAISGQWVNSRNAWTKEHEF